MNKRGLTYVNIQIPRISSRLLARFTHKIKINCLAGIAIDWIYERIPKKTISQIKLDVELKSHTHLINCQIKRFNKFNYYYYKW